MYILLVLLVDYSETLSHRPKVSYYGLWLSACNIVKIKRSCNLNVFCLGVRLAFSQ
jgi:hypothetical protein